MAAANAQIRVAYAAYYPALTLSATWRRGELGHQKPPDMAQPFLVRWPIRIRDCL